MNRPWSQAAAAAVGVDSLVRYIREVSELDRNLGSADYNESLDRTADILSEDKLELDTLKTTMDGEVRFGNWAVPYAWEPRGATLRVVSPVDRLIIDRDDVPVCLRSWSAATEPGGVAAELVDVGDGLSDADYEGVDVRGKVVLMRRGGNWQSYQLAVARHGALGVVSDDIHEMPPFKTREEFPDMVLWYSLKEREADGGRVRGWGLSISPRSGDYLRELLASGPVKVHVLVDATTEVRDLQVLVGRVPAVRKTEDAVALVAHICHPRTSATDNLSGCAVLNGAAAILARLTRDGLVPEMQRPVDFIYGPEAHASNVYASTRADARTIRAGIAVDMVGIDPIRSRGNLRLIRTSAATPSFLNDLISHWLNVSHHHVDPSPDGEYREFGHDISSNMPLRFSEHPYGLYSDNSALCGWQVPAVGVVHWPHIFWHTQHDTVDLIDRGDLAKVCWAVAMTAVDIATADHRMMRDFMDLVATRSGQRLMEAATRVRFVPGSGGTGALRYIAERDQAAIRSVLPLALHLPGTDRAGLEAEANRLCTAIDGWCAELEGLAAAGGPGPGFDRGGVVPRMKRPGVVDIKVISSALGHYRSRLPSFLDFFCELACLADGTRTSGEITRVLYHEFGHINEDITRDMITDLVDLGFMEITS